jgi:hypothetical protein
MRRAVMRKNSRSGTSKKNSERKKQWIRQHKKEAPITVDVLLPIPPGISHFVFGKNSNKRNIKLTITARPVDWQALYDPFPDDESMKDLGRSFYLHAIRPVYEEKIRPTQLSPPARGIHAAKTDAKSHATRGDLTRDSKNYVAAALAIVSYWLKRPRDEWPEFLRNKIETFKASKTDIYDNRSTLRPLVPAKVVFNMWKVNFLERLNEAGLEGPGHYKSFRTMYIQRNENINAARIIFKNLSHDSLIENLADYLL